MLIIPSRLTKDDHNPSPWTVCHCILQFLIFEDWWVNLHSGASSYMYWSVAYAGCFCHFWVQGILITFTIRTSTPRRRWASGKASQMSSLLPTSLSVTPSSRHHIQSSISWVAAKDWVAPLDPWGCPGPLAFIFFSMMASAIAQQPSCTIFIVASTCTVFLTQLTGLFKLTSTFHALL